MTKTANEWIADYRRELEESLAVVEGNNSSSAVDDLFIEELRFPSVFECADLELKGECPPRKIDQIIKERKDLLDSVGLQSVLFNDQMSADPKIGAAVAAKLPNLNLLVDPPSLPSPLYRDANGLMRLAANTVGVLTIELHAPKHQWSSSGHFGTRKPQGGIQKVRSLQIRTDASLADLKEALSGLPVDSNYDGREYWDNGGMFVWGNCVFSLTGDGVCDYSEPIRSHLDRLGSDHQYHFGDMRSVKLGDLPDIGRLIDFGEPVWWVHCGNEVDRLFITNLDLVGVPDNAREGSVVSEVPEPFDLSEGNAFVSALDPCNDIAERVAGAVRQYRSIPFPAGQVYRITYERNVRCLTWCLLCGGRAASLAVLDDNLLPETPAFVCQDCYRQFRSDPDGAFIEPDPQVQIYEYKDY